MSDPILGALLSHMLLQCVGNSTEQNSDIGKIRNR